MFELVAHSQLIGKDEALQERSEGLLAPASKSSSSLIE